MTGLDQSVQFVAGAGFLGFLAWLFSRKVHSRSELMRLHLEGRNRLLERFASSQEFLAFARTDEGRSLLDPPHWPAAGKGMPLWLRLIALGLAAVLVGLAFNEVFSFSMNWRAANIHLNEEAAWYNAISAWRWKCLFFAAGGGLMIGGVLSALALHLPRLLNRERN
jgi:hypothetical protein